MQRLTEIALEKASGGVFTRQEVDCWLGGSSDRQFGLLRRALRAGEVLRIHRGLYCLSPKYLPRKIDPFVLAQRIHGPSYVSLESALWYHGWIPEAVYTVTSVSAERSREFDTPLGRFSFTRVPQHTLYVEVLRLANDAGGSFLLASPLKALADFVYVHKADWGSARPVAGSLRVDEALLAEIGDVAFDRLLPNYPSRRVRRFLEGLREDLAGNHFRSGGGRPRHTRNRQSCCDNGTIPMASTHKRASP